MTNDQTVALKRLAAFDDWADGIDLGFGVTDDDLRSLVSLGFAIGLDDRVWRITLRGEAAAMKVAL